MYPFTTFLFHLGLLTRLPDVHPHWGGTAALSLQIQMLISSRNITDMSRIIIVIQLQSQVSQVLQELKKEGKAQETFEDQHNSFITHKADRSTWFNITSKDCRHPTLKDTDQSTSPLAQLDNGRSPLRQHAALAGKGQQSITQ